MKRDSLATTLLGWRRLIIWATIVSAIVAVIVSLLLPSWFEAVATVLPVQEGTSSGGFLSLISQLSDNLGPGPGRAARRLLSRTPGSDIMIGVLKSRRVRGQIVDQFDLEESYRAKSREHAIKELGKHLVVNTSPEGLIVIRVEDKDRKRSADMANAFLEHLDTFNREMSVADARRSLEFIGKALDESGERLDEATGRLRKFQEDHGTVEIPAQVEATVEAIATLQAMKVQLEIEKGVKEQFTVPEALELQQIEFEIHEVRKRIAALTNPASVSDSSTVGSDLGVFLPLSTIPELGLAHAELMRDVLVQGKVFEFLTGQFEDARIREASDQQTITVLDPATPPIRKARPRRSVIVLITVALVLFCSVMLALGADALLGQAPTWDPAQREALAPALRIARGLESRFGPEAPSARGDTSPQ
jgi:tyrosine-protein kinase Etk/Wzc